MAWVDRDGVVVRGHGVASGAGGDPRFPRGTVAVQLPLLQAGVPELADWLGGAPFAGTINVALAGVAVTSGVPDATVADLRWTEHFAPETFFLSRAAMVHAGVERRAWLYIPDPATKPPDHPPLAGVVELLARRVPGLAYGDPVTLRFAARTLRVTAG